MPHQRVETQRKPFGEDLSEGDGRWHPAGYSDTGCVFEMTTLCGPGRGLGITNIRERSHMLGGRFEIKSKPRGGTKVVIWVPVKAIDQAASQLPA
jgi:signal transduction histidine kinase